jgi:hypothetical protein
LKKAALLSKTLKKSPLISRPLPAEAGLIIQSGGQVLMLKLDGKSIQFI